METITQQMIPADFPRPSAQAELSESYSLFQILSTLSNIARVELSPEMKEAVVRGLPEKGKEEEELIKLLKIAGQALHINPPNYIASIFGPVRSWIPPYDGYSEYSILDLWRPLRAVKYLIDTQIPSIPTNPPPFGPPLLNSVFWHPTLILQRPDHNGSYTTFPDEAWILINGILTNDEIAQLNAAYLSYLFHRPITLVYNASDSFFIDLFKCAIGKQWNRMTEPSVKAFPVVYNALRDQHKKRVVLIAHSHGTIIAANVLKWLKEIVDVGRKDLPERRIISSPWHNNVVAVAPDIDYVPAEPVVVYPDDMDLNFHEFTDLKESDLAKLEIYCFANCATEMTYYPSAGDRGPIPWIENFGNEMDIVARLGMLAPPDEHGNNLTHIDGPCYVNPKMRDNDDVENAEAWGHLLNAHYLRPIQRRQKQDRRQGGSGKLDPYVLKPGSVGGIPRLFSYINGGVPAE